MLCSCKHVSVRRASSGRIQIRCMPQALKGRQTVAAGRPLEPWRCSIRQQQRHTAALPAEGRGQAQGGDSLDIRLLSTLMAQQADPDTERFQKMDALAKALDVPLTQIKSLAYKKRGVLNMSPEEVLAKIEKVASIVEVTSAQAREMVLIQPGLLFDTEKQAEALRLGIRAICYELGAPRDEVVELIIKEQSVLHGREMHLGAADMAHLAMLRQPRGRVVE